MDTSPDTQRGKAPPRLPDAPSSLFANRSDKFSASLIDPALRQSSDPSPQSDHHAIGSGKSKSPSSTPDAEEASRAVAAAAEAAEEQWVANVRLIEKLRLYIHERLSRGEYENEDESSEQSPARDGNNLHEKMEGVEAVALQSKDQAKGQHGSDSLYPVLKMNFEDDETTKMNVG